MFIIDYYARWEAVSLFEQGQHEAVVNGTRHRLSHVQVARIANSVWKGIYSEWPQARMIPRKFAMVFAKMTLRFPRSGHLG